MSAREALIVMKFFGWSWPELWVTPLSVYDEAVALIIESRPGG